MALQTIAPERQDLQQISICEHFDFAITEVGADVGQTV